MSASISALVVAASMCLVSLVGPRWVLSRAGGPEGPSDRVPADLIAGSVLVMVTAEVLVVLRLFEWLGLVVVALLMAGFTRWRRIQRREAAPALETLSDQARALLFLLEAASTAGNQRVKQAVRRWWAEVLRPALRVRPRLRLPQRQVAWRLSAGAVLAGGLLAQSAYALGHMALVPAGNYRQLTAMAELGQGRIFPFGAEPIGVRVLLATAAELTPASHEDVVRFAGPLLATGAVAMVLLLVLRATNRRDAALVAVVLATVAGLGGSLGAAGPPTGVSLAAGLSLLLALGGVAVAMQYATSPTAAGLRHLALAALGVVLVHPPSLVILLPALAAAAVLVAARQRRVLRLFQVGAAVGGGALAGWLPVLVGRIAGAGPVTSEGAAPPDLVGQEWLLAVSLAGALLALLIGAAGLRAGRPGAAGGVVLAVAAVGWLVLARTGLPVPSLGRHELLVVILPVGVGLGLSCLRRRALVPVALATLAVWMSPGFPPQLPDLRTAATEHDSAARAVSRRLAGVTDMSYTVIGSPVSLSRVVGRTWRVDLATFVRHVSLEQAADPGFVLPVPSDDILLVAEIRPPVPPSGGPQARRQAEVRGADAQRADEWMAVYARHHPGVSVLLDDEGVRVWSVQQTGNRALAERFRLAYR